MRPLLALLIYLVSVFVGGALLAPWLHALVQAAAQAWPGLEPLAELPFHRYLTRSLSVLALAGLWPLMRGLGIRSWADMGFVGKEGAFRQWRTGFLLGFGSLALVVVLSLGAGARGVNWDREEAQIVRHMLNATMAALVVSVLEEVLFRGVLFGGLKRHYGLGLGLGLSSSIYALVHFLAPVKHFGPVTWDSGLALLPDLLAGFGDLRALIPALVNLLLVGALLALLYQRTGSLFASIGLHAGWIFWLKTFGFFTVDKTPSLAWLLGTGKIIDGWAALVSLALVWPAVLWLLPTAARLEGKEYAVGRADQNAA